MKKIFTAAALSLCSVFILTGCLEKNSGSADSRKQILLCTNFPQYDWLRELTKEEDGSPSKKFSLDFLQTSDRDIHDFQPGAEDLLKIARSTLFVYNGGESDLWVKDMLASVNRKKLQTVNLVESLDSKILMEEIVEGSRNPEDPQTPADDDPGDGPLNEPMEEQENLVEQTVDEHIWLSLSNASYLCKKLARILTQLDPDNEDLYLKNAEEYCQKLEELDNEYAQFFFDKNNRVMLFADRFPFRYFTSAYAIKPYAAFSSCHTESAANYGTVITLSEFLVQDNLNVVYKMEGTPDTIARSVADSSKRRDIAIRELDSLHTITQERMDLGETYLSVMKKNLQVIKGNL